MKTLLLSEQDLLTDEEGLTLADDAPRRQRGDRGGIDGGVFTWREIGAILHEFKNEPRILCGQAVRNCHDGVIAKIKDAVSDLQFTDEEFLGAMREALQSL